MAKRNRKTTGRGYKFEPVLTETQINEQLYNAVKHELTTNTEQFKIASAMYFQGLMSEGPGVMLVDAGVFEVQPDQTVKYYMVYLPRKVIVSMIGQIDEFNRVVRMIDEHDTTMELVVLVALKSNYSAFRYAMIPYTHAHSYQEVGGQLSDWKMTDHDFDEWAKKIETRFSGKRKHD